MGQYTSIALDSSGQPQISYYDATNHKLRYAYKDGTSWVSKSVEPGSGNDIGKHSSLALGPSDKPCISYYDDTDDNLRYAYKDATGWHAEIVDADNDVGQYSSLAIDASGKPHISYYDATNHNLRYAYKDGGGWHSGSVEPTDSTDNVGMYSSLALDSAGNPRISYYDATNRNLKYAYKDGSGWHWDTVDNTGDQGLYTSIAIDKNNNPHISYYDITKGHLKYAYKSGASWQITDVPDSSSSNTGLYTSIAVDSNNNPHISYYDANNKVLKYAYRDTNNIWLMESADTVDKGQYSSIAVDTNGCAHISYYDAASSDLKYAYKDAPLVASTDPANNATAIGLNRTITVTFNENLQPGTILTGITLKDNKNNILTTVNNASDKTLTIDPVNDFNYNTSYTVTIEAGSVKDASGNNSLAAKYTFGFTAQPDVPPMITGTDPSNGAAGIPIDKTINVYFSEDIQAGSNFSGITLKDATGTAIPASVTIVNGIVDGTYKNILVINPTSNLGYGTKYKVNIPAGPTGAIKDMTNNPLVNAYTFDFTTNGNAPPIIQSTDPAGSASGVPVNKTITITFNEAIQSGSAYSSISLKNGATSIGTAISVSGATLSIKPSTNLGFGTSYTVSIPASAVKDSEGNSLATAYSFSFTTQVSGTAKAPANLKASGSASAITLTWDAADGAVSYVIYRQQGTSGYGRLNTGYLTGTTYVDATAITGVVYAYYVVAVGSDALESAGSNVVRSSLGVVAGMVIYNDVPADAWFRTYVETLANKKAITGYPDGAFRPNVAITRAEFTKVLCLAMGWQLDSPTKQAFNDVARGSWQYQYVATAIKHGTIGGYNDGTFRPNDYITRAEISKIMVLTLDLPVVEASSTKFWDTRYSWAKNYIEACVKANLISGYRGGSFKPGTIATRAEACKMIVSMLDYKK